MQHSAVAGQISYISYITYIFVAKDLFKSIKATRNYAKEITSLGEYYKKMIKIYNSKTHNNVIVDTLSRFLL